jgi:hypothetical protein
MLGSNAAESEQHVCNIGVAFTAFDLGCSVKLHAPHANHQDT